MPSTYCYLSAISTYLTRDFRIFGISLASVVSVPLDRAQIDPENKASLCRVPTLRPIIFCRGFPVVVLSPPRRRASSWIASRTHGTRPPPPARIQSAIAALSLRALLRGPGTIVLAGQSESQSSHLYRLPESLPPRDLVLTDHRSPPYRSFHCVTNIPSSVNLAALQPKSFGQASEAVAAMAQPNAEPVEDYEYASSRDSQTRKTPSLFANAHSPTTAMNRYLRTSLWCRTWQQERSQA